MNPEKAKFALTTQYSYSALDTFNVCQFVYGPGWQFQGMGDLAEMISAVTGWTVTIEELQQGGARRLNMLRAFNAREGIDRDWDRLPERCFSEPLKGGASDGIAIDRAEFEAALEEYYRQAGWDPDTGNPTRKTLEKFGLGWIVEALRI